MSSITTHVLDTARGRPAANVPVVLEAVGGEDDEDRVLGSATTDSDGRARELLPAGAALEAGRYRLTFDTGEYFATQSTKGFYPYVAITFDVRDDTEHYHVPLLLSPHGFTTYRGS